MTETQQTRQAHARWQRMTADAFSVYARSAVDAEEDEENGKAEHIRPIWKSAPEFAHGYSTPTCAVQKEDFDITTLDVEMPIFSGLEALQALGELIPPVSFPIVMFTAYRDKEIEQTAMQYGAKEIIYKPILPLVFIQQIEAIVREC